MSIFSDFAKSVLSSGLPDGVPDTDNPFVSEDGRFYCRFDSIEVCWDDLGAVVWYSWRGRRIVSIRVDNARPSDSLVVHGPEGRVEIKEAR